MRIAIVGCGLIGRKRAAALATDHESKLIIVADIDAARAEQLAREQSCQATTDWEQVVNHPQIEAVIVSTVNKFLMPIAVAALERGKNVLVEKPMARNLAEARQVLHAANRVSAIADSAINHLSSATRHSSLATRHSSPALGVGFNHRHHPAIRQAHALCASGAIGSLMFVRCAYGHGGRPGYDKEWRADADLAGGGELLDQGVHVVDLCRWFLGDFTQVFGSTATYFWDLGYFGTAGSRQQAVISNIHFPTSNLQFPISNNSKTTPLPFSKQRVAKSQRCTHRGRNGRTVSPLRFSVARAM